MMTAWKPFTLDELIHIKHGYAFKGEFFSDEPTTDILVTPGNFSIGGGFKADKLKYHNGDFPESYVLNKGDVIVTMTDLSKQADTLGYAAKVPDQKGCRLLHNQRIGLVKLKKEDVDIDFLYWLMRTETYQRYIAGSATGSTVKHTSPTKICCYKFSAPFDKSTQRRIASILSAYDDLIENNLRRIKLLEEVAQRTYEEWFVKFRVGGEALEVSAETGLPEGWEATKVAQLLTKIKSSDKLLSSEIKNSGAFPVIDQSRDYIAGYTDDESKLVKGTAPIIVFGDHTRVLKFINFPFVRGADGTQILLTNNSRMPQHLFYQSLLRVDLSNYHYARHFKFLKECEVIMPTVDVAIRYEEITEPKFQLIKALRKQNQLLKQSRDILLPRLMNGTINVESVMEEELAITAAEPASAYK